jgi:hypothetical protein
MRLTLQGPKHVLYRQCILRQRLLVSFSPEFDSRIYMSFSVTLRVVARVGRGVIVADAKNSYSPFQIIAELSGFHKTSSMLQ